MLLDLEFFFGKGYLEGTQTKGGFVPEQHTDYIFTTVGEEWGFFGNVIVIGLFVGLFLRILYLAERQKLNLAEFMDIVWLLIYLPTFL